MANHFSGVVDIRQFEDALAPVAPSLGPVPRADRTLDAPAFYDFSFYEFLFPPELGGYRGRLSGHALATVDDMQQQAGPELAALLIEMLISFEQATWQTVRRVRRGDWDLDQVMADLLGELYRTRAAVLPEALQAYADESRYGIGPNFLDTLERWWISDYVRSRIWQAYPAFAGFWLAWPPHFRQVYADWRDWTYTDPRTRLPDWTADIDLRSVAQRWRDERRGRFEPQFEVFAPDSVNLGLRLVYRQEWRHLGTQPGEIVRTLPLGPQQTERFTVKVTRREKRVSTLEATVAAETETETTDTTKDSSELVREAAETFNWKVGAEAGGGIPGIFSASVSTEVGGNQQEQTKTTSSRLSEAMRKTATKIRRETKVSIVTETESTLRASVTPRSRTPTTKAP
jgi:hypothetical protein